jgi:hypothetical protein
MEPVINYQCWICPKCHDDHGRYNHKRCADNLTKDLTQKDEIIKVLTEAVEFYGDRRKWVAKQYNGDMTIIGDGNMADSSITNFYHGGKRARQALEKVKGMG